MEISAAGRASMSDDLDLDLDLDFDFDFDLDLDFGWDFELLFVFRWSSANIDSKAARPWLTPLPWGSDEVEAGIEAGTVLDFVSPRISGRSSHENSMRGGTVRTGDRREDGTSRYGKARSTGYCLTKLGRGVLGVNLLAAIKSMSFRSTGFFVSEYGGV